MNYGIANIGYNKYEKYINHLNIAYIEGQSVLWRLHYDILSFYWNKRFWNEFVSSNII